MTARRQTAFGVLVAVAITFLSLCGGTNDHNEGDTMTEATNECGQ